MKRMKRMINGKEIKVTKAGYFYINGQKQTTRAIDPFYHAQDICKDNDIIDALYEWSRKNYRMV
jgi:hypothetical protein